MEKVDVSIQVEPLLFEFIEPIDGVVRHISTVYGEEIDTMLYDHTDTI